MKGTKWFAVLTLIVLVAMILAGCKAPPTATPKPVAPTKAPEATAEPPPPKVETVQIEFWTSWAPEGAQGMVLQALLDEFNASQDEVIVTHIYMGSKRNEKIAAGLAAGDPPDVAWISGAGENYYEEDLLIPTIRIYDVVSRDDFIEGLIATQAYLGTEITIPFENSNLAVYYNKDMLDEKGVEYPPEEVGGWTWTDFVEMAKVFSDADEGKFGYDPRWAAAMLHCGIWSSGGNMFSDDLRTNLVCSDAETRALTIKALSRLSGFVWESKITANDVGDMGFASGDMAFEITGPWSMPTYGESNPDLNIGIASLPADEDTGLSVSYWYQKALALFRTNGEQEEATLKFVGWFYSPAIHARWCAEAGYLPVTKSAMEHEVWKSYAAEHPYVQVFLDQAPLMKRRPFGPPQGDVGTLIDAVRLGEATPEEAIEDYCETAQEVLDEFWSLPHR